MQALRWIVVLFAFSLVAALAAEQAPFSPLYRTPKPERRLLSGPELAQRLPVERNKIEPIDSKAAFAEGYQAYMRHDLIAAIGRMRLAASQLPELADYAFFYLASAERDNGDSQDAADDFRRVTLSYPQSVWFDAANLEYARLELKLGHPDYALAAATRVADTANDPALEQN